MKTPHNSKIFITISSSQLFATMSASFASIAAAAAATSTISPDAPAASAAFADITVIKLEEKSKEDFSPEHLFRVITNDNSRATALQCFSDIPLNLAAKKATPTHRALINNGMNYYRTFEGRTVSPITSDLGVIYNREGELFSAIRVKERDTGFTLESFRGYEEPYFLPDNITGAMWYVFPNIYGGGEMIARIVEKIPFYEVLKTDSTAKKLVVVSRGITSTVRDVLDEKKTLFFSNNHTQVVSPVAAASKPAPEKEKPAVRAPVKKSSLEYLDDESKTGIIGKISTIVSSYEDIVKMIADHEAAASKKEAEEREKKEAEERAELLAQQAAERERQLAERDRELAETEERIASLSVRMDELCSEFSVVDSWGKLQANLEEIKNDIDVLIAIRDSLTTTEWTEIKSSGKKSKKSF